MSHSFTKLDLLLQTHGFLPKKIFTIDDYCVYLEILELKTSDVFLLYIPSQFNIRPDKYDIYKLKYIDIEKDDNIVTKYAEEPDSYDVKNDYGEIEIEDQDTNESLEDNLNSNYNKEIMLKTLNKNDKDSLKDIFRQLNRFKFCVQNINYKLGILYKNYLCTIKRDDSIECYYVSNFPSKTQRKLYISIDLKAFYKKLDYIKDDIKVVKDSIYKILNQNQIKHSKILVNMLENKEKLISYSDLICKKKEYYEKYILELENVLSKLNENEVKLLEEKEIYKKSDGQQDLKSMHNDIQNSHMLFQIDTKLTQLHDLKNELANDILKTRNERQNIVLEVDKILFDNSVMLNQIIKNFNSITQIIE